MKRLFKRKSFWVVVVIILLVLLGWWWWFGPADSGIETIDAEITDLEQIVSLIGRVQAQTTADLVFEQSGVVDSVQVDVGQVVSRGQVLASLSAREAELAVSNAQLDLNSARLTLQKKEANLEAGLTTNELQENYEAGLTIVTGIYGELAGIIEDLEDVFWGTTLSQNANQNNLAYYAEAISSYDDSYLVVSNGLRKELVLVKNVYPAAFEAYNLAVRGSTDNANQAIIDTYALLERVLNLNKTGLDLIQFFNDQATRGNWVHDSAGIIAEHLEIAGDHYQTLDAYLVALLAIVNGIETNERGLGDEGLDLEAQHLLVDQRINELADAQHQLSKYYLRAPFAGRVTSEELQVGERVAAGEVVVTLQSAGQFEIVANVPEVDIAKIEIGDGGVTTFDAYGDEEVFDLEVAKIDPAEVLIEGVPTYKVTLHLITPDERVRSGLTANIDLSTDRRIDVIAVPARAIISMGEGKMIKVFVRGQVVLRSVETGLRDSLGNIEVVNGLSVGDQVVVYEPNSS
ncbi:MAG: efflux RND transporter periplasmic adaptor subunit [Patescibacteria group bacterium]|nr:efflux RND transporter periplasmic adaptor subunit [Patescibacteria group bacterium]